MSINAGEAYTLDSFSSEAIKAQLAEAQKIANGSGSEQDITEAKIEIEVCSTGSVFFGGVGWGCGSMQSNLFFSRFFVQQVLEALQSAVKA